MDGSIILERVAAYHHHQHLEKNRKAGRFAGLA
jgi:hypothetical protein